LMQLEQLDLSHNELTSLPIELRKLISLRSLNVSHNKLVNTKDGSEGKTSSDDDGPWDCVGWWYDLEAPPQEIDLSFNQLTRLPKGLVGLRDRETEVIVDHNPLVDEDKKYVIEVRDAGKRFIVGWAEMIGQRPSMEDAMCIEGSLPIDGTSKVAELFALFDGHAGREAAHHSALHVKATVAKYLSELVKSNEKTAQEIFTKIFTELNEEFSNHLKSRKGMSSKHCGTTAVVAVIIESRLLVANVGDSRAVLASSKGAVRLTVDDKPRAEEERIRTAGGFVSGDGWGRTNGQLAVSRSLGDFYLHPFVVCTPHFFERKLASDDKFLIIACDGVWDEVEDEPACKIASTESDPFKASTKLRDYSFLLGSDDNISVMVVKL